MQKNVTLCMQKHEKTHKNTKFLKLNTNNSHFTHDVTNSYRSRRPKLMLMPAIMLNALKLPNVDSSFPPE